MKIPVKVDYDFFVVLLEKYEHLISFSELTELDLKTINPGERI